MYLLSQGMVLGSNDIGIVAACEQPLSTAVPAFKLAMQHFLPCQLCMEVIVNVIHLLFARLLRPVQVLLSYFLSLDVPSIIIGLTLNHIFSILLGDLFIVFVLITIFSKNLFLRILQAYLLLQIWPQQVAISQAHELPLAARKFLAGQLFFRSSLLLQLLFTPCLQVALAFIVLPITVHSCHSLGPGSPIFRAFLLVQVIEIHQ
mmetsp:Transcript_28732/g.82190  ORF Transcript_28732/g.82190 Transcript_28732/m.82190 type:complete len:204 (+) Transcript_28732:676-1287(+)